MDTMIELDCSNHTHKLLSRYKLMNRYTEDYLVERPIGCHGDGGSGAGASGLKP
jgi:hypothetical protein